MVRSKKIVFPLHMYPGPSHLSTSHTSGTGSYLSPSLFAIYPMALSFNLLFLSPLWQSVLGVHWKNWCWSWNSNTLATSCEELTHWKRPWCWEGLGAGGEGADRGWDGWMASPTRWAGAWVNSGNWWWTGRPGVLRYMETQSRTWLSDWTELMFVLLRSLTSKTKKKKKITPSPKR